MKIFRILFLGLLAVVTVTVLIGFFRSDEKNLVGTWGVPETEETVSVKVELDGDYLILIADDGSETSLVRKD